MSKWTKAKRWVENRLMFGRYTPSVKKPFVKDECYDAGCTCLEALDIAERVENVATTTLVSKHYCSRYCNAYDDCKESYCLDFYEVCDTVNTILADMKGD